MAYCNLKNAIHNIFWSQLLWFVKFINLFVINIIYVGVFKAWFLLLSYILH